MSLPSHPSSRRFDSELEIAAPRAVVWEAISSGEGLCRWFAPQATLEPKVGGEVVWQWNEEYRWPQKIEVIEPETRLLTRYDSPVKGDDGQPLPLFVDFLLSGEGGRTTLRLVHSGFGPEADFDQEYDGITRGWPVELSSLKLYAERHAGRARQVAWSLMPVEDASAAWTRLSSSEGLGWGADLAHSKEGQRFSFTTPDGDRFEGTALVCAEREFSGIAENWDGAFLRCSIDDCGSGPTIWLWLSTWEQGDDRVRALQARWDARLQQLFPASTAEARV